MNPLAWFVAVFAVVFALLFMSFCRVQLIVVKQWLMGGSLHLETCGCKHIDLYFGRIIFVFHFGTCHNPAKK
jgi:hypothetical protein